MRRAGPLLIHLALCAAPGVAWAQHPLTLRWEAPRGCPSEAAVIASVARLRSGAGPSGTLEATARVTRDGRRWRVRIETPAGVRSLAAPRCALLGDATAVVLALALDDARRPVSEPVPTLPPEVEQLDDAERPPAMRPRPPPPTPSSRGPRVELGARLVLDANALSELGVGGLFSIAVQWSAARLELAPGVVLGTRAVVAPRGAAIESTRVSMSARLCAMTRARAALGVCALVDAGILNARSYGFTQNRDEDAPWLSAGATLIARLGAGMVALDLALPIARPRFVVRGSTEVYEVPAMTLSLSAGVSLGL